MIENDIIVLIVVRATVYTVIGAHVPEAVITAFMQKCAGMCAFQGGCSMGVFYTLPKSDLCSLVLSASTQPGMLCRSCVMSHHINTWSCVMSHCINPWSCVMSHHINAWSCVMSHDVMWCLLMVPTVWCEVCELKSKFTTLYLCVITVRVYLEATTEYQLGFV